MVRAFDTCQNPPILFQLLDDLSAIHGGYYNHLFQVLNMNYVDAW